MRVQAGYPGVTGRATSQAASSHIRSWAERVPRPPYEHDPARHLKDFETVGAVLERRKQLVRALERGDGECRRLAEKLRRCCPKRRCGSGACPLCLRRLRRWLTSQMLQVVGKAGGTCLSVCLIPAKLQRPPGQLNTVSIKQMGEQLRTHLRRSGLGDAVVMGGIDISFNEDGSGRWAAYWQPHFHLICVGAFPMDRLRRFFPTAPTVGKPLYGKVIAESFADRIRTLSYAWKSAFFRRVSFLRADGNEGRPRYTSMKVKEQRELALWLDAHSPFDRLFLRNLRNRGWRLVPAENCQRG